MTRDGNPTPYPMAERRRTAADTLTYVGYTGKRLKKGASAFTPGGGVISGADMGVRTVRGLVNPRFRDRGQVAEVRPGRENRAGPRQGFAFRNNVITT